MAKKTCIYCIHFSIEEYNCLKMEKETSQRGKCNCNKFVYEESNENDSLVYWDYESYSAGFNVGINFGCIHFKRRK